MEGMVEHAGSQARMAHKVFRHVARADSQINRNGSHTGRQGRADRAGRHSVIAGSQAGRQVSSCQGGQGRANAARIQVVRQGRSGSQCRAGRKIKTCRQVVQGGRQGRARRQAVRAQQAGR
jgi:hypothetical protein